jgi:hypothetical protein
MRAVGLFGLILLAQPAVAGAVTTISQGFSTNDKVAQGSIVSLQKGSNDQVDIATAANADNILGVVINDNSSLLSLSNQKGSQVQVATSGLVQVLVSDINGDIAQGDSITASPISGVGMKATSNTKIVGIAQGGLPDTGSNDETYTGKDGKKHTVKVGQAPVLINVSYFYKQPDKSVIPPAIQNVANAFAGKDVDTVPILISAGIFIVTMVIVVSIVYSMLKNSIISVGRNPMSQSAIYRDLLQMSALVVGILVVAVASIYMVLTKF